MPAPHLLPLPPGALAAVQGVMSLKADAPSGSAYWPSGASASRPMRRSAGPVCAGCWHTTGNVRALRRCLQPGHREGL